MPDTLIMNGATPLHWAVAGVPLGLLTLLLLFVGNTRLGLSTGFESVCSMVSRLPYFRRPRLRASNLQRLSLFAGLLVAGVISAVLSGGWTLTWDMGRFDTLVSDAPAVKVGWMFAGGILIGFGTRLAGGCTSGHAMFGMPNMEWASIRSTLAFMATGVLTSNIVYRVLFV